MPASEIELGALQLWLAAWIGSRAPMSWDRTARGLSKLGVSVPTVPKCSQASESLLKEDSWQTSPPLLPTPLKNVVLWFSIGQESLFL